MIYPCTFHSYLKGRVVESGYERRKVVGIPYFYCSAHWYWSVDIAVQSPAVNPNERHSELSRGNILSKY